MVLASACVGVSSGEACHGVLQRELQGECEGGRRHDVGEAGEGGKGGRGGGGGRRCDERGEGRGEKIRGGVHEGGDAGGAALPAAESQDGAPGEAGAAHEARHGEGEHAPGELRGGESPLPPDLSQGLSALRIAELPHEGGARDAGESHAAPQDDDAQPRGLNQALSIEEEFAHHKPGLARLNNGSFGSCPKSVLTAQNAWSQWWLRQPDECYFGPLKQALHRSRQEVARLIHAPVEEVFLLENVTAAASMVALDVMWAFTEGRYRKGDSILTLNFTYGAVKKAFQVSISLSLSW
jgi:hypothetical protein